MPQYFKFYVNNEFQFRLELETRRCEGHNKDGHQCRRNTVIGTPYCFTHIKSKLHLQIKQSNIPNAGKGLFAYRKDNINQPVFKKGDILAHYDGEEITRNQLIERYGNHTAPYAVKKNNNLYIDAAGKRGVASIANTSRNTNLKPNVELTAKLNLKAKKNIYSGDEILISYDKGYKLNEPNVRYETNNRKY